MAYSYSTERLHIFTEEGQVMFLKVRDKAKELLALAGAFRPQELFAAAHLAGDSWLMLACIDRLVELGEITLTGPDCPGQHQVYTSRWSERL